MLTPHLDAKIVGLTDDNVTEPAIVLPRAGFETEIFFMSTSQKFLRAAALDKDGNVLGMTTIIQLTAGGEFA